jgi:hypothetical protein
MLGAAPARADGPKPTDQRLTLSADPALRKVAPLWDVDGRLFVESKDAPAAASKAPKPTSPAPQLQLKSK